LPAPEGTGERVAKLCGSKAIVDVTLDAEGRVTDFAQDVKACALGQAAAGVVGESVIGATSDEIADARDAMLAMLKSGGEGPQGRFEGLRALKLVADYPARHASTMVAIEATLDAIRQAQSRDTADTRTSLAGAA
jgi:NifU-like protein involved in Fe-S cluster formation